MSHKSENITTSLNSKNNKSITEMDWEEILALPIKHIPRKEVSQHLRKTGHHKE